MAFDLTKTETDTLSNMRAGVAHLLKEHLEVEYVDLASNVEFHNIVDDMKVMLKKYGIKK